MDNIIGNLAAMQETDDSGEQLTLKTQIVGAMRTLAGSAEGQAAITGLVSGRPELVGLINSVLGVASVADKGDNIAAKEGDDSGANDETKTGDDADIMESTPTESLSEETSGSANAAAQAVGEFSDMLGTFDSSKLADINPRRRIRLTASDFWELNLHKFFSMPENLIGDFKPVFVTFTVSCQPGWRTREGFAGIVDVRAEYMYTNDEGASIPLSGHPSGRSILPVAGIYPAYDSQELNLRNSQRHLRTFAAQLAAGGELAAAKVFLEAAEKREQDAETNTGIATVTGYSNGSHGFGYEFRPTFRALEQPGNSKTKPGFRLEPISFPAVAIALVDQAGLKSELHAKAKKRVLSDERYDIRSEMAMDQAIIDAIRKQAEEETHSRFTIEFWDRAKAIIDKKLPDSDSWAREDKVRKETRLLAQCHYGEKRIKKLIDKRSAELAEERIENKVRERRKDRDFLDKIDGLVKVWSPTVEIVFHVTHTWRPLNPPLAAKIPLLDQLGRLFQPRFSEHDFVERLVALGRAYLHFDETFCQDHDYNKGVFSNPLGYQYACEALRRRWLMLASQAVNFESTFKLKTCDFAPRPKVTVDEVYPTRGWKNADTAIVITGTGFKHFKESTIKGVVVGGVACDFVVTGETSIVAVVPKGAFDSAASPVPAPVTVVSVANVAAWTNTAGVEDKITFDLERSPLVPKLDSNITISRHPKTGQVTGITIPADAIRAQKDGALLDAIRGILKNEKCCADLKVKVTPPAAKKAELDPSSTTVCLGPTSLIQPTVVKIKLPAKVKASTGTVVLRYEEKGKATLQAQFAVSIAGDKVTQVTPMKAGIPPNIEKFDGKTVEDITLYLHEDKGAAPFKVKGKLTIQKEVSAKIDPKQPPIQLDMTDSTNLKFVGTPSVTITFSCPVSIEAGGNLILTVKGVQPKAMTLPKVGPGPLTVTIPNTEATTLSGWLGSNDSISVNLKLTNLVPTGGGPAQDVTVVGSLTVKKITR